MFSGNSRACAVISGLLLKLETDYNMILNLESAGLILEKNATRNDWTENDIVAFTDTYVIGTNKFVINGFSSSTIKF